MTSERLRPVTAPSVQVIAWQDIITVVDNGRAHPNEYALLQEVVTIRARMFSAGLGCLAVIPRDAVPPTDAARAALNSALQAAAGSLSCMCWLVEGAGFQAAMVKAVLTGVRLLARPTYATHVTTTLESAVHWVLQQLPDAERRHADIAKACQEIRERRRA